MNFSYEFVFKYYFKHLFDIFQPTDVIIGVMYILIPVVIGKRKGWKSAFRLLAFGYFLCVLYVTVISRPPNEHFQFSLIPLNSYFSIDAGDRFLLPQVMMNIFMFVPVGFLLKFGYRRCGWKEAFSTGLFFSLLIELLQLALMKGTAEVDDVIHNTFGCVIGFGLATFISHKYVDSTDGAGLKSSLYH